jgi:hypothetical protein
MLQIVNELDGQIYGFFFDFLKEMFKSNKFLTLYSMRNIISILPSIIIKMDLKISYKTVYQFIKYILNFMLMKELRIKTISNYT